MDELKKKILKEIGYHENGLTHKYETLYKIMELVVVEIESAKERGDICVSDP